MITTGFDPALTKRRKLALLGCKLLATVDDNRWSPTTQRHLLCVAQTKITPK